MNGERAETSVVKTAGRGVIAITAAKVWFMITGWILVFGLPRIFKDAAGGDADRGQALFGAYKLVVMGVSFLNNGIITGTIQAVSKFTSEDETRAGAVRRTALRVQGAIGVILAVIYVGFAGLLADTLGSPDLAFLMRLTAGILVAYSCYAVFIGSFNGRRLFSRQALFDITYSTVKTGLVVALAAAGFEVLGTVVGFLAASIVIAVAAAVVSGRAGEGSFPVRRYLPFAALLIGYTFLLNLVMSLDLFLLKGITSHLALAAGQAPAAAADLGERLAGQYGAAQGLAFIPYQAIISVAFVAFPMISRVTFENDAERTKSYVRQTMRFATILIVGLSAVFAALPGQSLGLVFPPEYRSAAPALGVLSGGLAAFGLLAVSNTILNGAGMPWRAMAVISATLAAVAASATGLVWAAGPGPRALVAAAAGSSASMVLGLAISGIVVRRRLGAFWPAATVIRVAVAATAAVIAGRLMPDAGKIVTLAECLAVIGIYGTVLVLGREFTTRDLDQLRQVVRRSGKRQGGRT